MSESLRRLPVCVDPNCEYPYPHKHPESAVRDEYRCEGCGRVTDTCKVYRFCGYCVS